MSRMHPWWRKCPDAALLVAAAATLVLGAYGAGRVTAALRHAAQQSEVEAELVARLAAEAAALQLAEGGALAPAERTFGACRVTARPTAAAWQFEVANGGRSFVYTAERLPGGAPPWFAGGCQLGRTEVAAFRLQDDVAKLQPDAEQLAGALPAAASPMFRRDGAVALARLAAGTEADDYVVDPRQVQFELPQNSAVVVVDGHLWLEPGAGPWRPWLDRDVAVVVLGNLYCGASIEPVGPGRLVLAVVPPRGAVPVVDLDGNGRWSVGEPTVGGAPFHGPLEGGGSVYFGRPGAARPIEVQACLVARGELHLWTAARVAGAVVAAGGVTPLAPAARLEPQGTLRFATERELVPGFAAVGPPRLGLVRPVRVGGQAAAGEELLYLATPAR